MASAARLIDRVVEPSALVATTKYLLPRAQSSGTFNVPAGGCAARKICVADPMAMSTVSVPITSQRSRAVPGSAALQATTGATFNAKNLGTSALPKVGDSDVPSPLGEVITGPSPTGSASVVVGREVVVGRDVVAGAAVVRGRVVVGGGDVAVLTVAASEGTGALLELVAGAGGATVALVGSGASSLWNPPDTMISPPVTWPLVEAGDSMVSAGPLEHAARTHKPAVKRRASAVERDIQTTVVVVTDPNGSLRPLDPRLPGGGGDDAGDVEAEARVDVARLRIVRDELGGNAQHGDDS